MRKGLHLVLGRIGFLVLLLLAVPVTALAVLFAPPFEPWRRAKAEQLLSDAVDLQTRINGPIDIGFNWEPTLSIAGIQGLAADMPDGMKAVSAKSLSLKIGLLPLLAGRIQLRDLVVDGLRVDLEIPIDAEDTDDDMDVSGFTGDFVRSRFADDIWLHNAQLNYVNLENGFAIRYAFDTLGSKPAIGGGAAVTGTGSINGEPWRLDGKVDPAGADTGGRHFTLTATQAGLTSTLAGLYILAEPVDSIEAKLEAKAPALEKFLAVFDIRGDLNGTGSLSARLSGPLSAVKASGLAFKLAFESGDVLELTGTVTDLVGGDGLDLVLDGSLAPRRPKEGQDRPLYDLGVTGFSGRIEGSTDEVLVRDAHVQTNSVKAQLRDIGPITAERLYKDPDGRLGLYDLLILAGDPARPCVRIAGTIKDILEFQGIELSGKVDFLTADFFDLAAEERAAELGHLTGSVAVSDADGSLGIEQLSAKVSDSALLALSIDLVFDDLANADELKFDTHVDIPKFKALAAALGSDVEELGRVRFDGTVTGGAQRVSATGKSLIGETTITGTLTGAFAQGRPALSGDISTQLLHLSDILKLSSINAVYQANVDDKDVDVFDYAKVWETLFVDLQIKVARIAGGGDGTSNIQGRVTYLAGVIGIDPVTMTFLGGKASANGKVDTRGAENTFALKGSVDNMRIGAVLKELKTSYPVSGALQVRYDLRGAGNSLAQIPKSLDGSLTMSLRNGWLGTGLLDLAGLSLPAWLLTRSPRGSQANLVCAVAPFTFAKGKGTTHGLVLETRNVQVVGVGFIDFRQSQVNLRFKPQALHPQFIKIAQPFAVSGPLSHPRLRLTGAPVAGAVVEVLAFPFFCSGPSSSPRRTSPAGFRAGSSTPPPAGRRADRWASAFSGRIRR